MTNQGATRQSGQKGFPLDNLTYDLVAVLYEKSKGLEAYDKYLQDAQNNPEVLQLFEKMRQQDEQCIREISEQLGLHSGSRG
jgi:uncharacterized membrane protein YcjF (UPF0283 family)